MEGVNTPPRAGDADSAFVCLALLARFHDVSADPEQLRHRFALGSTGRAGVLEVLRAAKELGLRAREVASNRDRLATTALPAMAVLRDGHFVLIGAVAGTRLLIQDPRESTPRQVEIAEFEASWTGRLILITKRSALPGVSGRFDFSWFIPALFKYRHIFGEVLVASLGIQLLALATPLFFQVVVDKVLVHEGLTTLDVLAVGFGAVVTFEVLLSGLRTYVFAHTTNRIDVELGAQLYRHLQGLPVAFFQSRQVGTIVARVRELETIRGFLTGSTLTVVVDLAFTVVFFAVMAYYSPLLTWIVLASIPLYAALSIVVTPLLRRRLDEKFQRGAENQAFLVESVSGAETVKAMALEPQMQRRWEEQLAGYVASSFRVTTLGNAANQIAGLCARLTTILILWFGARAVIGGDLTVGQLVAFNMLAGRVSGPILRLVQLWQDLQQAGISVQKLGDILNAPVEPGYASGRSNLARIAGRISIERVTFRYRPGLAEALKNVTLDIAPGEVIGIVGRSGSGKSTLTRLVQRLYVAESGRIRIDGVDLAMIDPAWLRRQVGIVLQENFLFNRSVRDNIALADAGLPLEPIVHAAKMAGAHEFILELPEGYDTILHEHGANLSGGQRQRIAIARALVTNPRILIFDEATSALDYESERVIQDNMRLICKGRTVLIIAHRLTAVRDAHRIVVLERGEIVEEGGHQQLLEKHGHYASLYRHQAA